MRHWLVVDLSKGYLAGAAPEDLSLLRALYADNKFDLHPGPRVTAIDGRSKHVTHLACDVLTRHRHLSDGLEIPGTDRPVRHDVRLPRCEQR